MSAVIIPLQVRPNQNVKVTLSAQTYFINIRYNTRLDTYTFSLLDADQSPIISGQRIVPNYSLLSRTVDSRKPAGKLICIDVSRTAADVGYYDLGVNALLAYDSAA